MIDPVTSAIASADIPLFTWVSAFFDQYTYVLLLGLAVAVYLLYPHVQRNRLRIVTFATALIVAGGLALLLKSAIQIPRPCVEANALLKLASCPMDFAFPSGHTAFAFVFAAASLGTRFFPLFLILSMLIGLSRVYLGVHSINDVAAGAAMGLATYFVVEGWLRRIVPGLISERERAREAWQREKARWGGFATEHWRRFAHICFGVGIIVLTWLVGNPLSELLLLLALFVGMAAMQFRMRKTRVAIIDEMFEFLERPGVMPAHGVFMYVLGALLLLSSLGATQAMAGIAVLALGDGVATFVGSKFGRKTPIFYNLRKSWAGTVAFAIAGAAGAFPFIGLAAIPLAAFCAVVETLDMGIDDNLSIPLAALAFFLL